MESLSQFWGSPASGFFVAVAVGLLIGVERERRKQDPTVGASGGIRTHVIVALAGAIAAQFPGVWLLVCGAAFVGALVVIAYARQRSADPGLTSEITLFTTYLLGALAPTLPELAGAIGVVIALVLALRTFLHQLAKRAMSDREVLDLLLLAASALVVLPLMPDRAVDAAGLINPQRIWSLTVLVLFMNGAGYVALRTLGPHRGLPLAGFFGGLVSSTATIGVLGSRFRETPTMAPLAAGAAMMSSVATPLQVLILLAAIDHALLGRWVIPALVMTAIALIVGFLLLRPATRDDDSVTQVFRGRAFQPLQAIAFSVTMTALLWVAAWLDRVVGTDGAIWGLVCGGLADAHSAIAGSASLVRSGALDLTAGSLAIAGALGSNTLTKLIVARATGGSRYAWRLAPGLIVMWLVGTVLVLVTPSS